MVKLLDFIREWMDIRRESKAYCKSCEVLREQLGVVNFEKKQLLDKFVLIQSAPSTVIEKTPEAIMPQVIPWHIQRQMLIQEDRAKAATIRRQEEEARKAKESAEANKDKPIESKAISVEELEKELAIGSEENAVR